MVPLGLPFVKLEHVGGYGEILVVVVKVLEARIVSTLGLYQIKSNKESGYGEEIPSPKPRSNT